MAKVKVYDIEYRDVVLYVHGIYSPEEKQVLHYPDGSGYPGRTRRFPSLRREFSGEGFQTAPCVSAPTRPAG